MRGKAKMVGEPGSAATHASKRKQLRRKLHAQGVPAEKIERIMAAKAAEQQAARDAWEAGAERRQRVQDETYARLQLDDRKHRPSTPDPLLRGAGRAIGATAVAVKRSKAVTRFEYDQRGGAS